MFGGKDDNNRLNDIWSFSLNDSTFQRLKDEGEVPAVRNGHTMNYFQGRLYVFGGIHDITWELDDLHIYSLQVLPLQIRLASGPPSNRTPPARSNARTRTTPAFQRGRRSRERVVKRRAGTTRTLGASRKMVRVLLQRTSLSLTMKMG